ncbi:MAG: glutamate--tRNA ligase [Planctomycetota bacterium]|nr:glutamate--tRNA ligase [Planctomycetota bacterium]
MRVRFAPSPTGYLHIGNIRTALFNWMYARRHKGSFVLRIEDTDLERSKKEYEERILYDMRWLGIEADEDVEKGGPYAPYRQSERLEIYRDFLEKLTRQGRAYRCYCTEEELELRRKVALSAGRPPAYDNRCRGLTNTQQARFESEGRKPSWRFVLPQKMVRFEDEIRGEIEFDSSLFGDPVIMKQDGIPTYNFSCVVDDALMRISLVLRGEGHISNTPIQILLFEALGFEPPAFAHMSHTKGLSKRLGSRSIKDFEEEGYLPVAILNYAALLGWSPKEGGEIFDPRTPKIYDQFDISHLSKAASNFDEPKFEHICGQHIRRLTDEQLCKSVQPYLPATLSEEKRKKIALASRYYLIRLKDVETTLPIFLGGEIQLDSDALKTLTSDAAKNSFKTLLDAIITAQIPSDREKLLSVVNNVSLQTGVKVSKLFLMLRAALTGKTQGPEIHLILDALDTDTIKNRLEKAKHICEEGKR